MLSSVYKWRLFFIASHPVFAVNNTIENLVLTAIQKAEITGKHSGKGKKNNLLKPKE